MAITITRNIHREYYSTYRPIYVGVYDSSNDTAFIRGELFIEAPILGGTFQSTGIMINGYQKADSSANYEFNLMEYCRHYVSPGACPMISSPTYLFPGYFETARFKLKVWAVKYSQTVEGGLYDELGDIKETHDFTAIGTITSDEDSTDYQNDFTTMDRFVLGSNSSWTIDADTARPLTNMPRIPTWDLRYTKHTTVNINDYPEASFYSPVYLEKNVHNGVTATYYVWPKSGSAFSFPLTLYAASMLYRIPVHPKAVEWFYMQNYGSALNQIVDASGNLLANGISVSLAVHNNNFSNIETWKYHTGSGIGVATMFYNVPYSDKPNNGSCSQGRCRRIKFVFKNKLGGFDWFNCYGTQSKEVAMSGTKFDSHVHLNSRGFHGRKQLWTKREDMFSVMTQPLDDTHAEWLQELITSPQVWVQKEIEHAEKVNAISQESFLQPVLIDPGTYAIYNTEDNVNYIEFKYRYSNPITTQIG